MYARVVTYQVQPGKWDELRSIVRDSVTPKLQQQPGYRGGLVFTDDRTGKGMLVSLWESEAALVASETGGYFQEQMAKFGGVFIMPPFREVFEVAQGAVMTDIGTISLLQGNR